SGGSRASDEALVGLSALFYAFTRLHDHRFAMVPAATLSHRERKGPHGRRIAARMPQRFAGERKLARRLAASRQTTASRSRIALRLRQAIDKSRLKRAATPRVLAIELNADLQRLAVGVCLQSRLIKLLIQFEPHLTWQTALLEL